MKIIQNKNYYGLNIEKIEQEKNAIYMGDFALKDRHDNWTERPASIFWVEKPDRSLGHSNYFGIFVKYHFGPDGILIPLGSYITKGDSAFSEPITGLMTDKGDVLISGYRHDAVERDGYMIDGGRDYFRVSANGKMVKLIVDGPIFKLLHIDVINNNLTLAEQEY